MTRTREFSTWLATRWPRPRPGTSDVRRCRELGLAAYLVKPVTRKELRATVMKVLAGSPMLVTRQRGLVGRHSRWLSCSKPAARVVALGRDLAHR